jgi:aldose 1-epimerase
VTGPEADPAVPAGRGRAPEAEVEGFGALEDGRPSHILTLSAAGIVARVCDYGATLVSLEVPDRDGVLGGVVLGFDDVTGYETRTNNPFMGATVGRVANRTARATFELDGVHHVLHANEGENHLHGGRQTSFDRVLWELVDASPQHVTLRHISPDGDGGYPGELHVTARYEVGPSALSITYCVTTDRRTPVNMTQHAYFNLAGEDGRTIEDHRLRVAATAWTPVDGSLIPTGEVEAVDGTPFDLRTRVRLGDGIAALGAADLGDGYDHNLWLEGPGGDVREVAELTDPGTGRCMVLLSDQPCLQVYTGNRLGRSTGRGGIVFPVHGGVCLEPQHAPDSLHRPEWPTIVLDPGGEYLHRIVYRFAV